MTWKKNRPAAVPVSMPSVTLTSRPNGAPHASVLYVRLALLVLAEPPDPMEGAEEPLGRALLLNQYRHSRIKGWKSVFAHAIRDPLFLLATELPRTIVLELSERTKAWPADLRRRWTYAAAVGAIGGFVY
ncbi:hypothetical protein [Caulobacter sp.]|uniref:hypothetical protein n=1 Tax=Caulobacter sp. TaxID=78 RepID=UPI002B46C049|nr:hypothetical protein [Caulobacter sp.]HJV42768.1 hypothetical protein [Caulobacter sp.]